MSKKTNYDYEQEKEIWLCMSQAVIHVYHVGKKAEMFVIFCEEKEIKTPVQQPDIPEAFVR